MAPVGVPELSPSTVEVVVSVAASAVDDATLTLVEDVSM
jgi:hypothetical protein